MLGGERDRLTVHAGRGMRQDIDDGERERGNQDKTEHSLEGLRSM